VARPTVPPAVVETILTAARADIAAPEFQQTLAAIPGSDSEYASQLVACDRQFARQFHTDERHKPGFGIALLLNKLLWCSSDTNSVPIVGRSYARTLIEWKLSKAAGGRFKQTYRAFSTDLTSSIVDDTTLAQLDIDELARFKIDNAALLERHQLWLSSVAQQFSSLADGETYDEKLAELEIDSAKKRLELADELRDSWLTAGLSTAKRAIESATSKEAIMAAGAIVALRGTTLTDLLVAAVPAALGALGQGAVGVIDVLKARADTRKKHEMAYLFGLQRLAHGGAPR